MPESEVAALAVNHRNLLRSLFRTQVMVDQTNADLLFLRDRGISGSQSGLGVEQVMNRVIANLQKPNPEPKQAVLPMDFTLQVATKEQLDAIYAKVIGSAARPNAGVTGTMTEGAPPAR
jgi:hypothetical protein